MDSEKVVEMINGQSAKPYNSAVWITLGLFFFVLVALIVFFSTSPSRIQQIEVYGQKLVSEAEIKRASGVQIGHQYLFVRRDSVAARIMANGSFVSVRVEKSFPGKLFLYVKEQPHVAVIIDENAVAYCVLANGKLLAIEGAEQMDKPLLSGWRKQKVSAPALAQMTELLAATDDMYLTDISEIMYRPDEAYPDKIILYMRSGFVVETTLALFAKKIPYVRETIENFYAQYQTVGELNMLTADDNSFTPFIEENNSRGTTQNEN